MTVTECFGKTDFWENFYECPKCEYSNILKGNKFCPNCGEALEFLDKYEGYEDD